MQPTRTDMIRFRYRDQNTSLFPGELFSRAQEAGFRDTAAQDLLGLVAEIESGRPWRQVVQERYAVAKPWLHRIITDPSRTAFFDPVLPPTDGVILDLGAGWGQTCRPLATQRRVVALEPVAERLAFIQAAARQDGVEHNLHYIGADYFDVHFETKFSLICAIGVFEWVGAFQNTMDPQERQRQFLRKTRQDLATGGSLILGIENRLGLKYLLGCPDDHIGVPHIASLPAVLARQRWHEARGQPLQSFTYSLTELDQWLHAAGFAQVEFFAAFPDYKLPAKIIPLTDGGAVLDTWLADSTVPAEHNGYDGSPLAADFMQSLQAGYRDLAASGQARHFVPSFFIRAS
jgi:SAM-dependent methyltransferase